MLQIEDSCEEKSTPLLESLEESRKPQTDPTPDPLEPGPNYSHSGHSVVHTSISFHDYCEVIVDLESISRSLNKSEQTVDIHFKDSGIQTESVTKKDIAVQTDFVYVYKNKPEASARKTEPETQEMGIQTNRPEITIEDICKSNEKVMFYTGIPDSRTFSVLFDEMSEMHDVKGKGRNRVLRPVDEFLMVLMRLRLGLLLEDLSYRFKISKAACSRTIAKWVNYLDVKLNFLINWPDKEINQATMPPQFKDKYSSCRVIIDCTELYTETPQSLTNRSLMYSSYKSHMTYKALIGINPRGVITFVSDLWAGSISDKQITKRCGILDLVEKGDSIMADKGFLIKDLTTPRGIELVMPPFKTKNRSLSRREVEETRRIANLRIHVERAIERVKNFKILQGNIPITLAKQTSKTWKLCAKLSNLQPPLVIDK